MRKMLSNKSALTGDILNIGQKGKPMRQIMRRLSLCASAIVAGFALNVYAGSDARATLYDLNVGSCGLGGNPCTNIGPFGTVEITGGGNSITYAFNTTSPTQLFEGQFTTVFMALGFDAINSFTIDPLGMTPVVVSGPLVSGTSSGSFGGFTLTYFNGRCSRKRRWFRDWSAYGRFRRRLRLQQHSKWRPNLWEHFHSPDFRIESCSRIRH